MLENKLKLVEEKINRALQCRQEAKHTGDQVTLVAVTKNHGPEVITQALALGLQHVGENRVQEAKHKQEVLPQGGIWHLIGHLQTNKARQAVALFDLIESVDSLRLLELLDHEAARINKVQDVLLQLNIAHEEQKTGFSRAEYLELLPKLSSFSNIRVRGLMVIAPAAEDMEAVRPVFAAGYRCYCRLQKLYPQVDCLSMGMSHDYPVAIEEGANIVRVGTALFGPRDYSLKF